MTSKMKAFQNKTKKDKCFHLVNKRPFFLKELGSLLVCAEEKLSLHGKRAVCTCMYEQLGLTQYEGF